MNLNQRLNTTLIIFLSLIFLITGITSNLIFNNSLNSYLENQREYEFSQISTDITNLLYKDNSFNPSVLQFYAETKNVNIKYFDLYSNKNIEFKGAFENSKGKYITKEFKILDLNKNQVGNLQISYYEDTYLYNDSIVKFQKNIFKNYSLIFIVASVLASIIAILISSSITNPIRDIKELTSKIRQGKYNTINTKYNIYELDELSSNLNYLSNTLSLQNEFRTNYAHDIAHELRTPLTNLLLHLEGIKDKIIEIDDSTIDLMLSEVKRLNTMTDNLEISFNKTEKMTELNLEDISLNELLENVLNTFVPKMIEKNITFNKELNSDVIIKTDKNKLIQILSNILSNAIKAVDFGGNISIIHKSFKNREVIRIIDDGIGIKESDLTHIFERFYRVDNVRNTKTSGHGLGLAITKAFVDLLGYNISVNSTYEKGTEFVLTISK